MFQIVEVLGVSWGTAGLIHDYLTGSTWWAWMIDAGFLVAGVVSGGAAALMKQAAKIGLKQAIKGLTRRAALSL